MVLYATLITSGLLLLWQLIVWLSGAPPYILPGPWQVAVALHDHSRLIAGHGLVTGSEILAGLVIGTALGAVSAILIVRSAALKRWLLPLMVASQAMPVFALAPLLVLWLGYGVASKIAMAVLIIYFPVTAAFYDGLRRTERGWLDLAHTMGASAAAELRCIRIPAALPALASGIRVATAVAPIGAVVGEWVGASAGLGYLMLHANARLEIDLMFAALIVLAIMALVLYCAVDRGLRRLTRWQAETTIG